MGKHEKAPTVALGCWSLCVTFPVFPTLSPQMRYTPEPSQELGISALALTLAIKSLAINLQQGITRIGVEIEALSHFSDPEIRWAVRLVKSVLLPEDWQRLLQVEDQVEWRVLVGSDLNEMGTLSLSLSD